MHSLDTNSIFSVLRDRELNRRKVNCRPCVSTMTSDVGCSGSGVLSIEPNGSSAPPLAIAFGKTVDKSHLLAVADEEGFVCIFNTCRELPSLINSRVSTSNARKELWLAHSNAVFDICWIKSDKHMLTASGDQTVRLWDVEARTGLGIMKGHSGSVKTICGHPTEPDVFASGSRDGNVAFWDVRCNSFCNSSNDIYFQPMSVIKDAHSVKTLKRSRLPKVATKSVTSVLYLRDDRILATAGAADGVVKFWDTRQLKTPVVQTPPQTPPSADGKEKRVHGISGLSQHPCGNFVIASCTDSRIQMYDVNKPEQGSVKSFGGHILGSFYIKATFSPDGTHILSGSSDGNVYIWNMSSSVSEPVSLKGHGGEVTAVDWCSTDFTKIATCSDDYTARVWSISDPKFEYSTLRPSVLRKRISAEPTSNIMEEANESAKVNCTSASPSYHLTAKLAHCHIDKHSSNSKGESSEEYEHTEMPCTMECFETTPTRLFLASNSEHEKSPDAKSLVSSNTDSVKTPNAYSPVSVLNPPSSTKRRKTISDYYRI